MALPPSRWRQSDIRAFCNRWERNTAFYDPAGWQAHGLGESWAPHVDESTGRTYWWHTVTRETRWDQPQTEPLPAGWECYLDPDTGNYWYHQQDTGFWRWTAPVAPRWRRMELYLQAKLARRLNAWSNRGLGTAGQALQGALPSEIRFAVIKGDGSHAQSEATSMDKAGQQFWPSLVLVSSACEQLASFCWGLAIVQPVPARPWWVHRKHVWQLVEQQPVTGEVRVTETDVGDDTDIAPQAAGAPGHFQQEATSDPLQEATAAGQQAATSNSLQEATEESMSESPWEVLD